MVRSASRSSAPASNVLRQEIDLSPSIPPANAPQEETLSFWEELCAVPVSQWASEHEKGFKVYLYDHEIPRSPYLTVILHSFDVEWIKQNYGGGLYRAQLNDPAGRIVSKEIFAIDGDSKRKPPQNAQAAGVPQQQQPATDSFQSQVLEIMRESTRRQEAMMERIMDARGANPAPATATPPIDPNIMLRGVVDMFSGLLTKAQTPQPQMGLLEMVALIEKFKGPDLLTVLTQAKTAGLIPANGGGDLLTQLNGVFAIADKIGLSSGKGKSWAETLIDRGPEILEAGSKIVDRLQNVEATRLQTAREVRAIQQQRGGTVITPAPQPPAGQMPQHAQTQHYTAQPPGPTSGTGLDVEAPGTVPNEVEQAQQQEIFVMGKVVEAIARGDGGGDIVFFLDTINPGICTAFQGASVEQVIEYCGRHPILRKAINLPRFRTTVEEMVEEINSAPDEEMEPKVVN